MVFVKSTGFISFWPTLLPGLVRGTIGRFCQAHAQAGPIDDQSWGSKWLPEAFFPLGQSDTGC